MIWKAFQDEWILYRDDDIIVVNKPYNMPEVACFGGFDASLTARLKAHLIEATELAEGDANLAVVSSMDASASGLTVVALHKSAQDAIAKAAKKQGVRVRCVAVVSTGWRPKRARVLSTCGRRQMIELELDSGGLEELRAQLALHKSPIVGDETHSGQPASRLMLHASHVMLKHPMTGKLLAFETALPEDLHKALHIAVGASTSESGELPAVIERAAHRRWGLWQSRHHAVPTTAFRLLNGAGDGFDGLALDVYGEWLVVHCYASGPAGLDPDILRHLQGLGFRGIYVKNHPKQANTVVDAEAAGLAPSAPVWGEPAPEWLQVHEHGVPFLVRLADGLATGLYLDQRQSRQRVRTIAGDKSVLNLFAYTCAFGVAAGLGDAELVVNVDVSKRALAWGRRNLTLAAVAMDGQRFIQDDAFKVMEKYGRQGRRFDLVILDPPTYARTRRSRFSVASDYPKLLHAALSLVAPRGTLIACSNFSGMSLAGLRRRVQEVAKAMEIAQYRVRDCPTGVDFPGPWGQGPQLKAVEVQLG